MAWKSEFLSLIGSSQLRLVYAVRVVHIGDTPGVAGYVAASHALLGDPIIAPQGVVVNGPRITPGAWSTTLGTASVKLDGDLRDLKRSMTRGTFVEVLAGDVMWSLDAFEVIFAGQVSNISTTGRNSGILELRDLISALRCRPTVTTSKVRFFFNYTADTTIDTSPYVIGDSTLTVLDTTGFERETGGVGAIRINNGTDDPFVLRFDGTTATEFAIDNPADENHGTIRANAAIGSDVEALMFLENHPITATLKFLTSTGTGTNGDYDTLPESWGFMLPAKWVDFEDAIAFRTLSDPDLKYEFMLDTYSEDPLGWLTSALSRGGFFVTTRQGLLTVRAGMMSTSAVSGVSDVMHIDDRDISSASWQAFDPDQESEYVQIAAYGSDYSGGWGMAGEYGNLEDPASLPVSYYAEYDLTDLIYTRTHDSLEGIVGRIWEAVQRVPERFTFTLSGLRAATLAPGDFIRVSSQRISGRLERTLDGLDDCRLVVLQVSVNWGAAQVTIGGAVYATTSGAFA
jgi:hypothetical protein